MWRTLPTAPRRAALGGACPLLAACCAAARCGGAVPDAPAHKRVSANSRHAAKISSAYLSPCQMSVRAMSRIAAGIACSPDSWQAQATMLDAPLQHRSSSVPNAQ